MKGSRTMEHNSIPGWVFRPALMLALPLVLVALVAFGLTIEAGSGTFGDSSIVPTADKVNVGQQVGFALYVVNSSPVTVTDVLVWSPLPADSTYVAASGGAFPVVGGAMSDVPPAVPPEGHAYDARLHTTTPLSGADEVSGIAWVGDLPPGEMVALGLIVEARNPAGRFLVDEMSIYDDRELAGQFSGQAWVRPYTTYLPLAANQAEPPAPTPTPAPTATTTTVTFTIPYGQGLALGGGAVDEDYPRALAGSSLNFGDDNTFLGQSPPDGPYIPWYLVARVYAGWDTSTLPEDAEVQSATLVLAVGCQPPSSPFGLTVYRGIWVPPLGQDAWYAMGNEPVGAWDTADYPCLGLDWGQVGIDLDPTLINRDGLTLVEIRSDREGTPPTAYEMIGVTRLPEFPALVVTYREER